MKIVLTGSLGHIGQPLASELVERGHAVTVISSKQDKQERIEALGATAAIGSWEDVDFLTKTFNGADAVYTMVAGANYFDQHIDLPAIFNRIAQNYKKAIRDAGVKRVVNLSTIGAHLEKGSGILIGAHQLANTLDELPADVSITHMRPTSFFYNLYPYANMIKKIGFIAANYGGDAIIPWVAPQDIAEAIAKEITSGFMGRKIIYVASDERTGNDTAKVLGTAIGLPDLKWVIITAGEMKAGLEANGMAPQIAAGMVEMYGSLQSGLLSEDYYRNKPAVMGKIKLEDFAKEFAANFK